MRLLLLVVRITVYCCDVCFRRRTYNWQKKARSQTFSPHFVQWWRCHYCLDGWLDGWPCVQFLAPDTLMTKRAIFDGAIVYCVCCFFVFVVNLHLTNNDEELFAGNGYRFSDLSQTQCENDVGILIYIFDSEVGTRELHFILDGSLLNANLWILRRTPFTCHMYLIEGCRPIQLYIVI